MIIWFNSTRCQVKELNKNFLSTAYHIVNYNNRNLCVWKQLICKSKRATSGLIIVLTRASQEKDSPSPIAIQGTNKFQIVSFDLRCDEFLKDQTFAQVLQPCSSWDLHCCILDLFMHLLRHPDRNELQ